VNELLGLAFTIVFIAGAIVGWVANNAMLPPETWALFERAGAGRSDGDAA
jgi:hypothetical protein